MLRKYLIILIPIILLIVCLSGCGSSPQTVSLEVTCGEFLKQPRVYRELAVDAGNTFTVTLCTSATSGFLWSEEVEISNDAVVLLEHELKGKGVLDASSEETWTFEAVYSTNSTINMEYSRPWAIDDNQRLWTLELVVEVK